MGTLDHRDRLHALCPDCPLHLRSTKVEPPEGYVRVRKKAKTAKPAVAFEVVLTLTVTADSPEDAAEFASRMVGITHHVSVYAKHIHQEREVLSKRVRRK